MKLKVPDTSLMKAGEIIHTHNKEGVLQAFVITKVIDDTMIKVKPATCSCQKEKRHG